jgi:hypothetical protein
MVAVVTVAVLLQVASFFMAFGGNAMRAAIPGARVGRLSACGGVRHQALAPSQGFVLLVVSVVLMLGVTSIAIDPPAE